ncbi:aminotransferase class I/II-fold pyridoxal phosphate-dependent enzyme [Nesterenkonia sp. E16_7]|uniref:pyridoxal phosphate-dependent aminotransferase n=1 Tax=unclassified Nesterenkonia TaxID=2629769 RepID=UPI001A9254DF|nr:MULTISPECIES: aminotransferase class I/II-fold pyridoxal phosphate-dependent enzyme [unclassified Nesterenkonia]MBO0596918.1 aminotransferase class I/II-fold pyridoxal phosphate-dependent enzyme [Nesterenkonia sp. E16_10]MBO0598128.1 aminotransferase class I/II-fold pyridoxal phosphate-dependent enzyme [Nesterenkonia sp. E16_7]
MMPSQRSQVPGFEVMSILARIDAMRAAGRDVVSLTAGEPGSGAPIAVNQAAAEIHAGNTVLNYTAAMGIAPLREAIAQHYASWYGVSVPPSRIAITTGSSGAFMLSFLAAFDPGDRVALARPGYPAYRNILTALGIEVVDLDCGPQERFQPTIAQLQAQLEAGNSLAGLILASPANPTGTMIERGKLAELTAWCADHEVQLISDEIYHGISYGAENVSAAEMGEQAVVISSFSKYWGMPGWRLGWMVLPEHLVDPVSRLAGNVALCPPHATQLAAVQAFTPASLDFAASQVSGYAAARERVLGLIPQLGWGEVAPADGAFYVYAHLGEQLRRFQDSPSYCAALLEEAGVAIVPGTDFDPEAGHHWVRLSLAPGEAMVAEGLRRILAFQNGSP